jgi:hypothetical protein
LLQVIPFFEDRAAEGYFASVPRIGHNRLLVGDEFGIYKKESSSLPFPEKERLMRVVDKINAKYELPEDPESAKSVFDRLSAEIATEAIANGYESVFLDLKTPALSDPYFLNSIYTNLRGVGKLLFLPGRLCPFAGGVSNLIPVYEYGVENYFFRSQLYDFSKEYKKYPGLCVQNHVLSLFIPLVDRDFEYRTVVSDGIFDMLSQKNITLYQDEVRMTNYFTFADQNEVCHLFFADSETSVRERFQTAFDYGFSYGFLEAGEVLNISQSKERIEAMAAL